MAKYKLVVLTEPAPGREKEYNDWYQNRHLGDVVAVPGFKSAQRFSHVAAVSGDNPFPYLAIYEVETDDPDAVLAELGARAGTDRMYVSDALGSRIYASMYTEFGEKVNARG